MLHATSNGLRSDNKPVLCKDLISGEVVRFHSLSECGIWFRVPARVITSYIQSRSIYPFNGKYELVLENDDWRGLSLENVVQMKLQDRRTVVVGDDVGLIFDSPEAAGEYLGIKIASVYRQLNTQTRQALNGLMFYYIRECDDAVEGFSYIAGRPNKSKTNPTIRPITVTDNLTGHITEWDGVAEFGYVVGYSKNTIQKSMLLNNGRWRQYSISYKQSPTGS